MGYLKFVSQFSRQFVSYLCFLVTIIGLMSNVQAIPAVGPAGYLYIPEVDANQIAIMNTATNQIEKRIPIGPVPTRPAVLATSLDNKKVYVDNFGLILPTISIINRETGTNKTLFVGGTPLGIFTSSDGTEVYLPETTFRIEVVSTVTDKVVRTLHFPRMPVAAMSGPDGHLYVGFASGLVGVYNAKTGAMIKPPIFTGGIAAFWYTFSKDNTKMYVDTVNTVGVVDIKSWKLTKIINTGRTRFYFPTNPGAFTSTLSPDGTKLYVTLFGDNRVLIIDTVRDRVIGSIPTKGSQIGVTFSADGTRGYISYVMTNLRTPIGEGILFVNLITLGLVGPGQIIVFDPKNDNILATVPTRAGPGVSVWVPPLQ